MNNTREIAKNIVKLQKQVVMQALALYEPKVEHIINNNVTDISEIERALDALLDVAFDEQILFLYKKLCRYYFTLDQQTTNFYIQSYREMWDS
ncbi:hypothetical protein QJU23_10095 [Pasteurella atlantica]|uniref:Uncharacterized protein n=2 Tax=Pasteurellaceae TaxID=712 RepID=A0ACC6HPE1_9PAST|nr:hypothetical protein [Pasteurella atlantica]MDP8052761.1 hypothetical protein [Pasteurella atlantica]MDP8106058.1 hypothetical protein [Pasteurella atlantica]MDP8149435.1 hypothetical protein [Pasteurella atlantica]